MNQPDHERERRDAEKAERQRRLAEQREHQAMLSKLSGLLDGPTPHLARATGPPS